jgi:transposase-like protein
MANTVKKTAKAKSYYTLNEGRKYNRINNATRVIAASEVLEGYSVADVANKYNVTDPTIRNWLKTLIRNNPQIV